MRDFVKSQHWLITTVDAVLDPTWPLKCHSDKMCKVEFKHSKTSSKALLNVQVTQHDLVSGLGQTISYQHYTLCLLLPGSMGKIPLYNPEEEVLLRIGVAFIHSQLPLLNKKSNWWCHSEKVCCTPCTFCQVEPSLIDRCIWVSHGIQLKDPLQKDL